MEPSRFFHQQRFRIQDEIRVYQMYHVLYRKLVHNRVVQSHLFQNEGRSQVFTQLSSE